MNIPRNLLTADKLIFGLFIFAFPVHPSWAENIIGSITHLQGTLSVQHADGSQALLALQSPVQEKDVLSTQVNTYARVKFVDNSEIVLRPQTTLNLDKFQYAESQPEKGNILLKLITGGLRKVTGIIGHLKPENDVMETPVATIGIRGTNYGLLFCQGNCGDIPTATGESLHDGLHVDVVEGGISVKNSAGIAVVSEGEFGFVLDQNNNPLLVPPNQGVQITFPPAIMHNSNNGKTLDENHSNDQCTVQ